MDGLSAIANVIAVIQISAQVFDLCRTYYLNVKDARKDIQRLQNEVNSLQDVLINVVDLANAPESASLQTLNVVNQKDGPLSQSQLELTALLRKLDPGESRSKVKLALQSLKWPLHRKEIDEVLLAIGRYKASFILALTADQASLSLAVGRDVSEIKHHLESQKLDEDQTAIIRWLSITDPSVNFHASRRKCQPETGQWLINRTDFNDWKVSPNSLLWLYGIREWFLPVPGQTLNAIAGCGKTILSSTIIQHLQQHYGGHPRHAVAYFYFDFKASAKQEASACLSSLVAQLCTHLTGLPPHIKKSYERCNRGKLQPSHDELIEMLTTVVDGLDQTFLVIDALDECPKDTERAQLLKTISSIKSKSPKSLHLFVTSRRELDIEEVLGPLLTVPGVSLQGSQVDLDIQLHISSQLATDPKLKRWQSEIKVEIESTLMAGATGMFRWVVCQLDALKRCLKVNMIRKALKNLPTTLDDTYTRLFLDIDEDYRQEAASALLWLSFSLRPLRITELAEAIMINPTSDPVFNPENRFPDPQNILQILSSLISVSTTKDADSGRVNQDMIVTLAHFSVKEYLVSDRIQESPAQHFAILNPTSHSTITECCLLYLLYYANSEKTSPVNAKDLFPLLYYASEHWYKHFNLALSEQQKLLTPLALKLLLSESALSCWLTVHTPGLSWAGDETAATPLCYASSMGLVPVVEQLLSDGWSASKQSKSVNQPPLHRAIIAGSEVVVLLLLEDGADINESDYLNFTPLHHAAEEGNIAIVGILLDHGAETNLRSEQGLTALHLAAIHGHEYIAHLLIGRGAQVEVSAPGEYSRTPLHWAAWNNEFLFLDLLLKHGADINAGNEAGETALHYAATDNPDILNYLLAKGADVEVETIHGETPLYWASSARKTQLVELLLFAGARIVPPLILFSKNGFHLAFHVLLDVGMAHVESISLTLLTLQECERMGFGLCGECQGILSKSTDQGGTTQQVLPIRRMDRADVPEK